MKRSLFKQSQVSQAPPICQMIQALNYLCVPSLGSLQYVSFVLGVQCWTQHSRYILQCWVEGKDHFPQPAASAPPRADLDVVCLICHRGLLLACGQFVVHQDPFSAKQLFRQSALRLYQCPGLLLLREIHSAIWYYQNSSCQCLKRSNDLGINDMCYCSWKKGYLNTSRLRGMCCNKQKWWEKGNSCPMASECLILATKLLSGLLGDWSSTYSRQWELPHGFGGHWMKPKYIMKEKRNVA